MADGGRPEGDAAIPDAHREVFENVLNSLTAEERGAVEAAVPDVLAAMRAVTDHRLFDTPVVAGDQALSEHARKAGVTDGPALRRGMVAYLALRLPGLIPDLDLADSIISLYPGTYKVLAKQLSDAGADYVLGHDGYLKDLRIVAGLTVPCGGQILDLERHLGKGILARHVGKTADVGAAAKLAAIGVHGPWFWLHTDTRNLMHFSEKGWDACYRRVADMLDRRPHFAGLAGAAWFYDPQVIENSPRTAYLRLRPEERGAFFLRKGVSEEDTKNALSMSKARQELYDKGLYKPVGYFIIWPRKQLIEWARSQ